MNVLLEQFYHTTRVAGHAGLGAFVAGFVAATAPLSVPLYIWWRSDYDEKDCEVKNGLVTDKKLNDTSINRCIPRGLNPDRKID